MQWLGLLSRDPNLNFGLAILFVRLSLGKIDALTTQNYVDLCNYWVQTHADPRDNELFFPVVYIYIIYFVKSTKRSLCILYYIYS